MPMQMIACVPVKCRPSSAVARTRSPSRSTSEARAFSSIAMPRSRKASCTTSATSRSSDGRICGREDSSVTREPQLWKNSANSQPGRAGADDEQLLGQLVQAEHVAGVEHALVVDLGERRLPRRGAGAHEQMVVLEPLRAALGRRDEHAVALDRPLAVDDRGLDQVEPLAHAARLVLPDEAGMRLGAQQVDARAAVLEDEAARLGALDLGHRRGDLEQRLRRDAVGHRPVAAERHAVDDRDLGAERGGGRGGGVAGRAGSEDQEAHLLTGHRVVSCAVRSGSGPRIVRAQRLRAAPRRASQRQSAHGGPRRLGLRRAAPDAGPARRRRRLHARLAAAAAVVIPAGVELALLPGLVLGAHDAEDEVEQPDQRDLEPEDQPQEPEFVTHETCRVSRARAARWRIRCDMLRR